MDKIDIAKALAAEFGGMHYGGIAILASMLTPFTIRKNERLVVEGEVCRYMYYVEQGIVRQFYYKAGKDVTEHFSQEGGLVICIESFLQQEPSRLMIEALEPSVLWGIPHDRFMHAVQAHAEMANFYCRILEHALISSQRHADSQRFETAMERYLRLNSERPNVILRAPLIHVASFLQMTPETMSRVRATLEARKA